MVNLMRVFLCFLLLSFNTGIWASCPSAAPITSAEFCESFKVATECHCVLSGVPKGMCSNMKLFYKMMIDMLGPLQRSCASQHYAPTQECIDDWNCYRYGGLTSDGQLCSGTGHACA